MVDPNPVWVVPAVSHPPLLCPQTLGHESEHSWIVDEQREGIPLADAQHASLPLPPEDNPKEITSSEHSQDKWGVRAC